MNYTWGSDERGKPSIWQGRKARNANVGLTDGRTDQPTDRPTNGPSDTASCLH